MTSCFKFTINKAPRFATILSTLRGSLNAFWKCAEVRPYTELIAVFNAPATPFAPSSFKYGANFPSNNFFAVS